MTGLGCAATPLTAVGANGLGRLLAENGDWIVDGVVALGVADVGPLKAGTGGIVTRNSGDLIFNGLLEPFAGPSETLSVCRGDFTVLGELVGASDITTSPAGGAAGDVSRA